MSIITVNPADKWFSLNVVMASTMRASFVAIDNHEMWVYEVDGGYVGKFPAEFVSTRLLTCPKNQSKFKPFYSSLDSA